MTCEFGVLVIVQADCYSLLALCFETCIMLIAKARTETQFEIATGPSLFLVRYVV